MHAVFSPSALFFLAVVLFGAFSTAQPHVKEVDDCYKGLEKIKAQPLPQLLRTPNGEKSPSDTAFYKLVHDWFSVKVLGVLTVQAMVLDEKNTQFSIRMTFANEQRAEVNNRLQRLASVLFLTEPRFDKESEETYGTCLLITATATYRLSEDSLLFLHHKLTTSL